MKLIKKVNLKKSERQKLMLCLEVKATSEKHAEELAEISVNSSSYNVIIESAFTWSGYLVPYEDSIFSMEEIDPENDSYNLFPVRGYITYPSHILLAHLTDDINNTQSGVRIRVANYQE